MQKYNLELKINLEVQAKNLKQAQQFVTDTILNGVFQIPSNKNVKFVDVSGELKSDFDKFLEIFEDVEIDSDLAIYIDREEY